MFQPLHTGALGLVGQQRNIDVIGNNVANIGTLGFKSDRLDFQDTLYTRMFNKVNMGPEMNLQRGTGVRVYQTATQFMQGAALQTHRNLDLMLEGTGFFVLENPQWDGENEAEQFVYSRNGSLYIAEAEEGEAVYLVDGQGRFIVDENLERVAITGSPELLRVDQSGVMSYMDAAGNAMNFGKLQIADFVNPGGLGAIGGGYYMETTNSGEQIPAEAVVAQGYTEASNVELAEEMTRLIRSQRAYQIAARCVTTADQMLQVCNQLGR